MTLSRPPHAPSVSLSDQIAAAIDWWREAGVDHDFADAARDWLAGREPAATALQEDRSQPPAFVPPAPPPVEVPRIGGDPAGWPQDLAAFAAWWLAEPALDGGLVHARVPPRGPKNAELMVLVDHPEAGDSDVLLSGEQGRLLGAILAALGLTADRAYIASALPRHMPHPDWAALRAGKLADLLLHHIALAEPKRLIVFSPHVSSLLGHDPANSPDPARQFYHVGAQIPALAAPGLDSLMARPRGKAAMWRALLDWQGA